MKKDFKLEFHRVRYDKSGLNVEIAQPGEPWYGIGAYVKKDGNVSHHLFDLNDEGDSEQFQHFMGKTMAAYGMICAELSRLCEETGQMFVAGIDREGNNGIYYERHYRQVHKHAWNFIKDKWPLFRPESTVEPTVEEIRTWVKLYFDELRTYSYVYVESIKVATHLMPYYTNGDATGLQEDEISEADAYLNAWKEDNNFRSVGITPVAGAEDEYQGRDDVTGKFCSYVIADLVAYRS